MCRSARPSRSSVMARPSSAHGRHRVTSTSRSGQMGKNTAHHCSGASSTIRSKAVAIRVVVDRDAVATCALPGHRDPFQAPAVASHAGATDAHHVHRRLALDREHRRAQRQGRWRPEEFGEGPATGQVAVADEPHARPATERRQELATGLAKPHDAKAHRARGSARTSPAGPGRRWSPSVPRPRRRDSPAGGRGARSPRNGGPRR